MRVLKFRGKILKRLSVMRCFFYVIQLASAMDKPVPSENEMMYIRQLIIELQQLSMRYDVHCLKRDWANDERNGHAPRTIDDYKKALGRLGQKWQQKGSEKQLLATFPFGEKF